MRTSPGREDTGRGNQGSPLFESIPNVEAILFDEKATTTQIVAKVETLSVMLDCGKCIAKLPQHEVRNGTANTTCTKKHNKRG